MKYSVSMIESIEIINWKAHGHTRLSFARGPNILIGHMGAGKSSVMDAISFGLFGTFPGRQNRRVDAENIIRNGSEGNKNAKIRLSFGVDNAEYVVEREITAGGQAKATLQKNGIYMQSQPQRVTEEVEKALGMDYDLFSRAVYSEQNRLDYFLELKASDRKKQIDNLLGLDRFAAAQENNTSLVNRVKEKAEDGEKAVRGFEIEKQKEELALLEEKERSETERLELITKELEGLKAKRKDAEERLEGMKAEYGRKNTAEKKLAELKIRVDILSREILEIESKNPGNVEELELALSVEEKESRHLKAMLDSYTVSARNAQTRMGKLEHEAAVIERDAAKKKKDEEELGLHDKTTITGKLEGLKKEIDRIEEEIAHNAAVRKESEKWIRELQEERGKCPVCERDLDERMRAELLKAKSDALGMSTVNIEKLMSSKKKMREEAERLESTRERIAVIENSLKAYADIDARRDVNAKELAETKKEVEIQAANLESASEKAKISNEKIASIKSAREFAVKRNRHMQERRDGEKAMVELKALIEGLRVGEAEIEELQKSVTVMSSEAAGRASEARSLASTISEKKLGIAGKRKEIKRISDMQNEIEYEKFVVGNLVKFGNSLLETQTLLRRKLIDSVNKEMGDLWPELYPYGDYTGIELVGSESDYTLKLCVQRNEREIWESVDAVASGGERNIACLAMRIAFAKVLAPNLRWLILDEPTHNIDSQGINKFIEVFNEKLPKMVEQVFIITHEEQMKQVSGGRVFVLGRDKAKNEETQVSEA